MPNQTAQKVYTNSIDRNYHTRPDCRWALPTGYQEAALSEVEKLGKTPCPNCAG